MFVDKNNKELVKGSIIDIHQTVNGENIFVIFNLNPLDIRYGHDISYKYQYSKEDLITPNKFTGESDFEIVGNIRTKKLDKILNNIK